MNHDILLSHVDQRVATLTLNRPEKYNALSEELLIELSDTLTQIKHNKDVSAVVIQSNGKAFCTGHDLKQMRQHTATKNHQQLFALCSRVMQQIIHLPQPVIAKVQGIATAAGCQLVATCDLAVASDESKFAVSGIRLGLFCSTPAVALSRNIGPKKAMEMLLTGDFIDAETALHHGLINQIVSPNQLDQATNKLVARIVRHPENIIKLGKQLFYRQLNEELSDAYCEASKVISNNMLLPETIEGIDAFIEKRSPQWSQ